MPTSAWSRPPTRALRRLAHPLPESRAIRTALRAVIVALAIAAAVWAWTRQGSAPAGRLGLFTSLPILWNEEPDLAGLLRADAKPHWARAVLAKRGAVVALDRLAAAEGEGAPLAGLDRIVIAQPRPLAPDENLALDAWVRGGGKLLLFADPALSEPSAFALGDPRRPQDLVLLSPILGRWGLELTFDEAATDRPRTAGVMGVAIPVDRPGRFRLTGSTCRLWGEGVAATCRVGRGRVLALADSDLLARDDPDGARAKALGHLLDSAFAAR